MQIQLKQADIEQAIKNHIAAIGIQREVDEINFTMGRKSSGLIADINVSDREPVKDITGIAIPRGFESTQAAYEVAVDTPVEKAEDTDIAAEEEAEEPVLREEEATASSEKSSLFGS